MSRPENSVGIRCEAAIASTSPTRAGQNQRHRQIALGAGHAFVAGLACPTACRAGCRATEAKISGRALSMLRMPPAATAPAPM